MLRKPIWLLAFGFGSGKSPLMPGTVGTLLALPLYFLLAQLPTLVYIVAVFLSFFVGVYLCERTSKELDVHDHKGIVWDEFVGLWITLIMVPSGWLWLIVGFVLFRFFDMVKPWPICVVDRKVHGGFGIMLDDVLAGIAALACIQVAALWV